MYSLHTCAFYAYLYKYRVRLVVDSVRVVELAIVPQDFAHWGVLLGHCKHPARITAFGQQLPVEEGFIHSTLFQFREILEDKPHFQ